MFDPKNSNTPKEKTKRISWTVMLWIFSIPLISMIFSLYASSFLEKDQSILIYPIQAIILIILILINRLIGPKNLPSFSYLYDLKSTLIAIPMVILFGISIMILGSELDNVFKNLDPSLQQTTIDQSSDPIQKVENLAHLIKIMMEAAWVALYEVVIWHVLMQRNLKAILPKGFDLSLVMLSAFLFYPIQMSHYLLPTLYLSAWLYQKTNTITLSWLSRFVVFANLSLVAYFEPMIPGFDDLSDEWQPIWFDFIGMITLVLAIVLSRYLVDRQAEEKKESLSNDL
jgi:hypothetical protein